MIALLIYKCRSRRMNACDWCGSSHHFCLFQMPVPYVYMHLYVCMYCASCVLLQMYVFCMPAPVQIALRSLYAHVGMQGCASAWRLAETTADFKASSVCVCVCVCVCAQRSQSESDRVCPNMCPIYACSLLRESPPWQFNQKQLK